MSCCVRRKKRANDAVSSSKTTGSGASNRVGPQVHGEKSARDSTSRSHARESGTHAGVGAASPERITSPLGKSHPALPLGAVGHGVTPLDESDSSSSSSSTVFRRLDEENIFLLADDFIFRERLYTGKNVVVYRAYARAPTGRGPEVVVKFVHSPEDEPGAAGFLETKPLSVQVLERVSDGPNLPHFVAWHRLPDTRSHCEVSHFVHARRVDRDSPTDVRNYVRGLLTALAHMHSIGILYRDVKPENVLMHAGTNATVVIDFDVSTFLRSAGHRSVVGTEGYMAPEVLAYKPIEALSAAERGDMEARLGLQPYGTAADLYSAGVLFGELLFPHAIKSRGMVENAGLLTVAAGSELRAQMGKSTAGAPAAALRAAAVELVVSMLVVNPAERVTAPGALAHAYFSLPAPGTPMSGAGSRGATTIPSPNPSLGGSADAVAALSAAAAPAASHATT